MRHRTLGLLTQLINVLQYGTNDDVKLKHLREHIQQAALLLGACVSPSQHTRLVNHISQSTNSC